MTDQPSEMFELPDNWTDMTDAEQNAWVEAALVRIFEQE